MGRTQWAPPDKQGWRNEMQSLFRHMMLPYLVGVALYTVGLCIVWTSRAPDQDDVRFFPFLVSFVLAYLGTGGYGLLAMIGHGARREVLAGACLVVVAGGFCWGEFFVLPALAERSPQDLAMAAVIFPVGGLACVAWWSLVRPRLATFVLGILVVPVLTSALAGLVYALVAVSLAGGYFSGVGYGDVGATGILAALPALFAVGCIFVGFDTAPGGEDDEMGRFRPRAVLMSMGWIVAAPVVFVVLFFMLRFAWQDREGRNRKRIAQPGIPARKKR